MDTMSGIILDAFAGPGGWSEGLRLLGLSDVGIEWDAAACATRAAAGHLTIRADVAAYPTAPFVGKVDGWIGSPPCTSFSTAGKGKGRDVLADIVRLARRVAGGDDDARGELDVDDPTAALILEPVRWVRDLRPRWVALEQVPPCLPVWQEYARIFRAWGYHCEVAVLNAADFGVPQTRRRAILVGRLDAPAHLPTPTHAKHPSEGLFGSTLPWVSMAEALGWDGSGAVDRRTNSRGPGGTQVPTVTVPTTEPAPTLTSLAGGQWIIQRNDQSHSGQVDPNWPFSRPATTLVARGLVADPGANANRFNDSAKSRNDGIKISVRDAAILQSFPAEYPWHGTQTKQFEQVGNAVPPRVAAHAIAALLGIAAEVAA
jgi:DNA (cytosine-5)-methyltransferase 1